MHVLLVFANPNPSSFSAAVVEKVRAGVTEAGNTAEIADLAKENFDPRMLIEDLDYFGFAQSDWSSRKVRVGGWYVAGLMPPPTYKAG